MREVVVEVDAEIVRENHTKTLVKISIEGQEDQYMLINRHTGQCRSFYRGGVAN